jgi:hypothetical protein
MNKLSERELVLFALFLNYLFLEFPPSHEKAVII